MFMEPEYWHGKMYYCCDMGGDYYPADDFTKAQVAEDADCEEDEVCSDTGWYARLSASGYLDSTEWSGPFETEEEAREHIQDAYDVDPDTGEDWEEKHRREVEDFEFD